LGVGSVRHRIAARDRLGIAKGLLRFIGRIAGRIAKRLARRILHRRVGWIAQGLPWPEDILPHGMLRFTRSITTTRGADPPFQPIAQPGTIAALLNLSPACRVVGWPGRRPTGRREGSAKVSR
jgi:hypothetical protein